MFISSVALWIACLLVYVASPNQKLLKKSLIRKISYPLFFVFVVISWLCLSQIYHGVIAGLVMLIQVMVMWPSTVFIVGHLKPRLTAYLITGAAFFSLISLLGATT